MITGQSLLLIEVAVTHFADEEKKKALAKLQIPAIEIDLSGLACAKWDWALLRDAVVQSAAHKQWLYPLDYAALEREATDAAISAAWNRPATSTTPLKAPPRTRYWIHGRLVDVIERPFGLTVWSPYDPALNEMIKSCTRRFGGFWQPKYKNWFVPLQAKSHLENELSKFSGRPPELIPGAEE